MAVELFVKLVNVFRSGLYLGRECALG